MLDHLRINSRIAEIRKRILTLQKIIQSTDKESFIKDELIMSAAERNLEVAIQACLDIAAHLIAQIALEKPKENKELFSILAKHKIIHQNLADKLVLMSGLRNILVHEYLKINEEKVYYSIKNDLDDLIEFVKTIEIFIEKQNK